MLGSPACGPGGGTGAGGLAQPKATAATVAHAILFRSAAVIAKLELDAEVLPSEEGDHRLQIVLRRARHPDFFALDAGARLAKPGVLDRLHDLLRGVRRDSLREGDVQPH